MTKILSISFRNDSSLTRN